MILDYHVMPPTTPAEQALRTINETIAITSRIWGGPPPPKFPSTATSLGLPQCEDTIPVPCCQRTHRCTRMDGHTGLHEHLTPAEERAGDPPEYRWWRMSDGTVIGA